MMANILLLLPLLMLCCDAHASRCSLTASCTASQIAIFRTTALSSRETARLTCPEDADIADWQSTMDASTPFTPIMVTDTHFTAVGTSQLDIGNNVTGEFEGKYSCTHMSMRLPVGCVVVQGRAHFENCNGSSGDDGCSGVDSVVASNQQARLDMRVIFRDGGVCENQTIRRLEVEHDGTEVYSCSNILMNTSEPCFSTDKYHVDNSQCPQDCEGSVSERQCCKFRFFLTIINFDESDVGRYMATVTVEDHMSAPSRLISKIFQVSTVTPSTMSPTIIPTATTPTATMPTATMPTTTTSNATKPPVTMAMTTTAMSTSNNLKVVGAAIGATVASIVALLLVVALCAAVVTFLYRKTTSTCKKVSLIPEESKDMQTTVIEKEGPCSVDMTTNCELRKERAPRDTVLSLVVPDFELSGKHNSKPSIV